MRFLHHVTNEWLSRLDDDDVVTIFFLQLTLHVDRRSYSSCTLSYDTPPCRDIVHTLAAEPQIGGSTVLHNRMSRYFPEVGTRKAVSRRL